MYGNMQRRGAGGNGRPNRGGVLYKCDKIYVTFNGGKN